MTVRYVSFGAGLNSAALAVGIVEHAMPVNGLIFSDTGGERPDVYESLDRVSAYLQAHGYPAIEITRWTRVRAPYAGQHIDLETDCLRKQNLPSLAYGMKGCSVKFKAQPLDKAVKAHADAAAELAAGRKVERLIGYSADELKRVMRSRPSNEWKFRYPLYEWGWGRDECEEAVARAGLGPVAKSACFFCPAHTEPEIVQLGKVYPKLLQRALDIEANAVAKNADVVPSLQGVRGRPWREVWAAHLAGEPVKSGRMQLPCECFDGSWTDEE